MAKKTEYNRAQTLLAIIGVIVMCLIVVIGVYNSLYDQPDNNSEKDETINDVTINHDSNSVGSDFTSVDSESGLIFKLDSKTDSYIVIGTQDNSEINVVIPEAHNSKPVSGIGDKAFANCKHITNITIPTSVTYIGSQAFYQCIHLTLIIYNGTESQWENINKDSNWNSSIGNVTINFGANTSTEVSTSVDSESGLIFELDSKGDNYIVVGTQNKTVVNVIIPETHNGKPVTGIGDKAFAECTHITNISIPTSVTYIGTQAFYQCIHLTVIIYNGNEYEWENIVKDKDSGIGNISIEYVKNGNESSTTTGSNSVSTDPDSGLIFELDSKGDTYIVIGTQNKTEVNVVIPETHNGKPVTGIGDKAFAECTHITNITIPTSITYIGYQAFYQCIHLTVIIYNGSETDWKLINIDKTAIQNITVNFGVVDKCAKGHTEVIDKAISATCTKSGLTQGKHCSVCRIVIVAQTTIKATGHTEIIIKGTAATCTTNGKTDGKQCSVCKTIITKQNVINALGHTVVTLSAVAPTCTQSGLTAGKICSVCNTITVKQSVVTSSGHIASEWVIDKEPTATENGKKYQSCKKCGIVLKEETILKVYSQGLAYTVNTDNVTCTITGRGSCKDEVLFIPDSINGYIVTSIGDQALDYCSITSITIPDSVTYIGDYAFRKCSSLTSVTIGNGVTYIGKYAFYNCTSLASITIPNNVTSIGYNAFKGCTSLTSITIPDSVTSIDDHAFDGCPNLQYNTYDNAKYLGNEQNPYMALIDTINKIITSCTIHPNTKIIGGQAFNDCDSLTSITIPDSVTSIGEYAFASCTSLTSITIPDSVTSIGSYAFEGCNHLQYKTYDNAKYLGNVRNPYIALIDAKSVKVTSCTIHPNTKIVGNRAFYGCIELTSIIIPDSVTSIGDYALFGSRLTSITISDSVTSIGDYAFGDCTILTSITIPDSVTSIGYRVFYNCKSLTEVNYGGTIAKWKSISKDDHWDKYAPFTVVHCTDGDVSVS